MRVFPQPRKSLLLAKDYFFRNTCGVDQYGVVYLDFMTGKLCCRVGMGNCLKSSRDKYRGAQNGAQKKDPGRARQRMYATAGTNFTKPGAHHLVLLCTYEFSKLSKVY